MKNKKIIYFLLIILFNYNIKTEDIGNIPIKDFLLTFIPTMPFIYLSVFLFIELDTRYFNEDLKLKDKKIKEQNELEKLNLKNKENVFFCQKT
jgi:hypothetical protein